MFTTFRLAPVVRGVVGSCALALALASTASAANVRLHDIPTAGSKPTQLINGPDGRLWFTESGRHEVGRIAPGSGQFAPVALPLVDEATSDEGTVSLAPSTNGYVWALDNGGQELYRVSPSGAFVQALPYGGQGNDNKSTYADALSMPDEIVPAAGGGVWTLFSHHNPDLPGNDYNGASIVGDDNSSHLVTNQTYEDPHPGVLDPADGSLWVADRAYVTHIGSNGTVRRLPTGLDATYDVTSAVIGPDGSLWFSAEEFASWFTSAQDGVLGHVVGNQVHLVRLNPAAAPTALRVGPDGALWWAESLVAPVGAAQGAIGRLDPATGVIQEGGLGNYQPASIAFANDGGLWFVDTDANVVGQIAIDAALFPPPAIKGPPLQPGLPIASSPIVPKGKPAPKPTVASKRLRVKKKRIAVSVYCPKAVTSTCRGKIRIRTAGKVKVKGRKKKAIVSVSRTATYTVKRGKKHTIKLKLSKAGRAIVRHGHTTKVSVQLTPKGAKKPVTTRKVKLKG